MFLVKRNKTYYLRVRVPLDMVKHFRSGEIVRSLKTGNYKQAKGLAVGILGKLQEVYTMARSKVLSDEVIQQIIKNLVDTTLSFAEKCRTQGGFSSADGKHINSNAVAELSALAVHDGKSDGGTSYDDATEILQDTIKELTDRIRYRNFDTDRVDELLRAESITDVDKRSNEYQTLCREHLKAWQFINQVELERNNGNYANPYDIELRARPKSNKLSEVLDAFLKLKVKVKARTKGKHTDTIEKILDCLEHETGKRDVLLSDLDYPLTKRIVDRLSVYPLYRFTRHNGQTLEEACKAANYEPPTPATFEGDLYRLGSIFKLALSKFEGLKKNYMEGVAAAVVPDEKKKQSEYRDIFRPEDLQEIVEELLRLKNKGDFTENPHLLLVPLIALFQGCRVNEICQLRIEDIIQIDGKWCLSINEEGEGKSVKNVNSMRINPIHPALQEVGLLRFWEQQKEKGCRRFWEGEGKISCKFYPKSGNHSHYFSKWFNETFKNRLNLTNPDKQTFHSFRHTFLNWYRQNLNMIEHGEAVAALSGHLDKEDVNVLKAQGWDVTNEGVVSYMKDLNITRQYDTLKLLDYGLDLSGLVI